MTGRRGQNVERLLQPLVIALGLVPLALLVWDFQRGALTANPIEDITHRTGDWTIYLLLTALAVTPVRRLTGWGKLIRFRRTIGLLAFSYAALHFLTYLVLDQGLALAYVGEDIAKRPYITVGFTAFVLLIPLAITSTNRWVRRLGGRRWNALHRLVYIAGALGVLHYLWLVKGEQLLPVYLGLVLVASLTFRVVANRLDTRRRGTRPVAATPPTPRVRAPEAPGERAAAVDVVT